MGSVTMPNKREQKRATTAVSRWLGRLVNDDQSPVGVTVAEYRAGRGVLNLPVFPSGTPGIYGESEEFPPDWTRLAVNDLNLHYELADLGLCIEPHGPSILLIRRLDRS